MPTFAFVLATVISQAHHPTKTENLVLDTGLTREDCQGLLEAYKPSWQKLPNGLTISTVPACRVL